MAFYKKTRTFYIVRLFYFNNYNTSTRYWQRWEYWKGVCCISCTTMNSYRMYSYVQQHLVADAWSSSRSHCWVEVLSFPLKRNFSLCVSFRGPFGDETLVFRAPSICQEMSRDQPRVEMDLVGVDPCPCLTLNSVCYQNEIQITFLSLSCILFVWLSSDVQSLRKKAWTSECLHWNAACVETVSSLTRF